MLIAVPPGTGPALRYEGCHFLSIHVAKVTSLGSSVLESVHESAGGQQAGGEALQLGI